MTPVPSNRPRAQRGVILITSLIILLVITLIGVSSMQTIVLEEKMAGNLRDRNSAFQAAEAGLQLALTFIEGETNPPLADANGANNIWPGCTVLDASCTPTSPCDPGWLDNDANNFKTFGSTFLAGTNDLEGVTEQPRIVIEDRYIPPLDFEAAARGSGIHFYTACVLGYGMTDKTREPLQSSIAKVYAW